MECDDGSRLSSRVYGGREDGVMGSLAARRVAQSDRAGVWEAVIVDLFPGVAIRWNSSSPSAPLAIGADALGTRGDIERHCGPSIGPVDGWVAGPLAFCDLVEITRRFNRLDRVHLFLGTGKSLKL